MTLRALFPILFLVPFLQAAQFNLTAGTVGGVRADRFEGGEPADRNLFFISPSLNPSLTHALSPTWSFGLEGTAEAELYTDGHGDYTLESGLSLTKHQKTRNLKAGLSAGYYALPNSLDPDQPEDYSRFALKGEYRNKAKHPLRLSYALSLLNDADASRLDMKHKVRIKKILKPVPRFMAGLGAGLGRNFSNTAGYGYFETDFPVSATFMFNTENFLIGLVYLNFRWYDTDDGNPGGGSAPAAKKVVPADKLSKSGIDLPGSRTAGLYVSYCRSLSGRLDLEVNYDLSVFDSDFGLSYLSHKIYAGLEWRSSPL